MYTQQTLIPMHIHKIVHSSVYIYYDLSPTHKFNPGFKTEWDLSDQIVLSEFVT